MTLSRFLSCPEPSFVPPLWGDESSIAMKKIVLKTALIFYFLGFVLKFPNSMLQVIGPLTIINLIAIFHPAHTFSFAIIYLTFIEKVLCDKSTSTEHSVVFPVPFIIAAILKKESAFTMSLTIYKVAEMHPLLVLEGALLF